MSSASQNTMLPASPSVITHRTVLAAAGSGKTYQLSTRYLQLLHLGASPRTILATTFTRLAAGEIRDRIVQRLLEALESDTARAALAEQLGSVIEPGEIIALLRELVRNVDAQQIRTLDSFFASIVRTFSLELGLPPGSRIIDDEQLVPLRREAVRQLLDERDPEKFVTLFRRFTQGDVARRITRAIDEVVSELYDLYRDCEPAAWECIPQQEVLTNEQVIELQEAFRDAPLPDHKSYVKGYQKARRALDAHHWDAFLSAGLIERIRKGETHYYRRPIDPQFAATCNALADHASAVMVNIAADQTLATREMLDRYHERLVELKRAHGVMTFSDLTYSLLDDPQDGSLDELWFRLDGRIDHLLLDEFQDTAATQWRVLRHLAEEIVSTRPPERSLFCVGDMKQSIYGWRHAEPRLLGQLPQLLAGQGEAIERTSMTKTRRSAQPIVDAVNLVFGNLKNTHIGGEYGHAVDEWLAGFEEHGTHSTQSGYVELRELEYVADNDVSSARRMAAAVDCIATLHERDPSLHIGVLTRENRTVTRLLAQLGTTSPHVQASGYGGTSLTDAAPVNALLDLLQLADHPHDTRSAFHVACSPASRIVQPMLGDDVDVMLLFDGKNGGKERAIVSSTIRRDLLDRGYGAVISDWVAALLPDCDARQMRRLTQFADLAREWAPTGWHPIGDFITFIENRRVADVVPASVEIMTIHQAKGLEFDVVVLPELNVSLNKGSDRVAYDRADIEGPITAICRYMNRETRANLTELDPLFESNTSRKVRDSLGLLYVAMTRARRGLHMIIDGASDPNKPNKSMAGLLRSTLHQPDGRHGVLYFAGDDTWLPPHQPGVVVESARQKPSAPLAEEATLFDVPADDAPIASERRSITLRAADSGHIRGEAAPPASQLAREGRPLRAEMTIGGEGAFEHGRAMHVLFQQITWLDDFLLDDEALERIVRSELPRHSSAWARQRVRRFRELIAQPRVRELLTRPRESGGGVIEVHCELPIARLVGQRTQWSIVDRLVVHRPIPGQVPDGMQIIDYKTDDIAPEEAASAAAGYRQQMHTYREAAAGLFRIDPAAVTMQLLFVSADVVVDVE